VEKTVTFDSLILDIKHLSNAHLISSKVADKLTESIKQIQKKCNKKFKIFTQWELRVLKESLRFYDKKAISKEAKDIISRDIEDLINSL